LAQDSPELSYQKILPSTYTITAIFGCKLGFLFHIGYLKKSHAFLTAIFWVDIIIL